MRRIASVIVMVSVLTLVGIPATAPFTDGSAAYAQESDKQIKDELGKIKKMIADLETQLVSSRKMTAAGMEKTMAMLKNVSRMLDDLFREAPYRGE
jgi:hypothetical protein